MANSMENISLISAKQIRWQLPCGATPGTLTCEEIREECGEFSTAQNPESDLITPQGRYFAKICIECSALCKVVAQLPIETLIKK